mmetsp:Transcript_70084/g.193884  ORF Transcript_70084/g.193884 Transcript_70084/m.193884 type:complete len:200 (+) Transcript_70084:804-1403(+)
MARASAYAFRASSYFPLPNAALPSFLSFTAFSPCSNSTCTRLAVWSNFGPISSWLRQGDMATSRRKDSRGVMPVPRVADFVIPSVCVGSAPLCKIMAMTARGSSPTGGRRRLELWALAIQATATCSAVAPSWCCQWTPALRFSSSRQTLALPAARAVFSGGVCMRGSFASMSASKSSINFTASTLPCQHAVWKRGPPVI